MLFVCFTNHFGRIIPSDQRPYWAILRWQREEKGKLQKKTLLTVAAHQRKIFPRDVTAMQACTGKLEELLYSPNLFCIPTGPELD